jgi:hypothetical protein
MRRIIPYVADSLTPEQRRQAQAIFEGKGTVAPCMHCGGVHLRACPRVRKITWHSDGTCLGAEYWPAGQWSDEGIVWPEDAYEIDEESDDVP